MISVSIHGNGWDPHLDGLQSLQGKVISAFNEEMDVTSALQVMAEIERLGMDGLEEQCEHYIAQHFDAAVVSSACLLYTSPSPRD